MRVALPLPAMRSGISSSSCFEQLVRPGSGWSEIERELMGAGVRIPLGQTLSWAEHRVDGRYVLLAVRDPPGRLLNRMSVRVNASRVLPGHRFLTVEQFGEDNSALDASAEALARLAVRDPGVLRVTVRVFSRTHRACAAEALRRSGFERVERPRSYTHTLTLDLGGDEGSLLARLHKTARKSLRLAREAGLCVRALSGQMYADRISLLEGLSMRRTGGRVRARDWSAILELSQHHPELSRISGLFLTEQDTRPEALIGFGWGSMQGDHGNYTSAGMARVPGLKLTLGYPLVWDLIAWSKAEGATWFDLGGITVGGPEDDPLWGISSFKRHFSDTVEEVSEEWAFEPRPVRAGLARLAGSGVRSMAETIRRCLIPKSATGRPDELIHFPQGTVRLDLEQERRQA